MIGIKVELDRKKEKKNTIFDGSLNESDICKGVIE